MTTLEDQVGRETLRLMSELNALDPKMIGEFAEFTCDSYEVVEDSLQRLPSRVKDLLVRYGYARPPRSRFSTYDQTRFEEDKMKHLFCSCVRVLKQAASPFDVRSVLTAD